ncbi:MAG: DUF4097 family beta strand repeat protein [Acidobacteria bacterium]|nr:DUF4097 family beta strand repeat protein [Acidobacteriota bacterium]
MRLRLSSAAAAALMLWAAASAAQDRDARERIVVPDATEPAISLLYQGRNNGRQQTERISRKIKIGPDGRVSVHNIAGDITVTGGSGDEVSIEAVKWTRGDRNQLASVSVDIEERAGRIDVRTMHTGRNDRVAVDYTITLPSSAAVEVRSISGTVKVTSVEGTVRGETVSGDVAMAATRRLEKAKTVSGSISLTGVSTDGELSVATVSGNLTGKALKARGIDLGTISGDVTMTDVMCEQLGVRSVSGNVDFGGGIVTGGRYEFHSHSGDMRLTLANPAGFELNADSFSGAIRSDLPMTINSGSDRGDRNRRGRGPQNQSLQATYGDGSATVIVRTFSGDIVLTER